MSRINPIMRYEPSSNFNQTWGRFNSLYGNPDPMTVPNWPIREGVVDVVDYMDYTCTVKDDGGATHTKVRCLSPWFSYSNGHGINFCPESGSHVLLTKGPGVDEWFILGFIPIEQLKGNDETDTFYKNGKPDMTEGDIHISTDAGNFIFIQKTSHAIRIENTPVCFIDMQASENYIHICSQNVLMETKAALVTMMSDTPELVENEEGVTKAKPVDVCTTGFFRSNTSDYNNFVKIDIGKVSLNNPDVPEKTILALNICNKVSVIIDTDGNIKTYSYGSNTCMSDKDITTASIANINLKAASDLLFNSGGSTITNSGGNISENASGTISNFGGAVTHGSGSGSPDINAPYPDIPDNSTAVRDKPFKIKHLL